MATQAQSVAPELRGTETGVGTPLRTALLALLAAPAFFICIAAAALLLAAFFGDPGIG